MINLTFLILTLLNPAPSDYKLPATWTKDFTITLSYDNSMGQSHTDIRFTFDSCSYTNETASKRKQTKVYLMKEADRVAILKKLHELKPDRIQSESAKYPVNDGWSQSICFEGFNCIDGSAGVEMKEDDKNAFLSAYRYLEEFAIKKTKKR